MLPARAQPPPLSSSVEVHRMFLCVGERSKLACQPFKGRARQLQNPTGRSSKLCILSWARSPTAEKQTAASLRGEADVGSALEPRSEVLLKAAIRRKAKGISNISQFRRRIQRKPPAYPAQAIASPIKLPVAPPRPLQTLPFPGAHKPLGLIAVSAHILGTACQLSDLPFTPSWMPCAVGMTVGTMFAVLNRFGMRRMWRAPAFPLNVVITGASRGLGKALAREFLRAGDRVVIASRSPASVRGTIVQLRDEVDPEAWLMGIDCNVSSPAGVHRLADAAASALGSVDVWINNAGYSGSYQAFTEAGPEVMQEVVGTNLTGSLLCTRRAMQLMARQKGKRGHIFNMDGAGADGTPSPNHAIYGATKAGIAHLMGSLASEARQQRLPVSLHTLSPGMVLTNLLLEGTSVFHKAVFNVLCEQPETVAAFLVPRIRTTVARQSSSSYIRFLTPQRAVVRFLTSPFNLGRFFDLQGRRKYAGEYERIMGQKRTCTNRRADRFARRSSPLVMAYSTTMAASYLLLMLHALSLAQQGA
ncbi:hypothetical protein WJX73_000350 [Symbiochloris irregularis]|uniref:Chlorophyll b reductase n=1 Tax=Symbiochloris irregularis TaxID=706552 RepID=A0AAW1PNG2_9CHLO